MKYCTKCKANVNTQKKQCPVCFDELEINEENTKAINIYPTTKVYDNVANKNLFLTRLFLFMTISIASTCLFINFLTSTEVMWSYVVLVSMLYIWILVKHTIISKRGIFEKVLFQFLGILGVIMMTNFVAGSEQSWFWNYVVPSASLATTTALVFVVFVNTKRADFLLSFFLMSLVLITTSIILLTTGTDTFRLLNLINLLYTGLFALGIIIFGFKTLKRAFHKTLHI